MPGPAASPIQRLRRWWSGRDARPDAAAGGPVAGALGLAAVPLLSLLLAALLAWSPPGVRLGAALQDAMLRAVARPAHYPQVLLVDIDDASVRALRPRLGPWPYSRDTYALAVQYLRELGARVVVLDIVFDEPRNGDSALARALGERGDVVLAAAGQRHAGESDPALEGLAARLAVPVSGGGTPAAVHWEALALPASVLLSGVPEQALRPGRIGLVSTPLDGDGQLRRLPLLHQAGGRLFPSLALAPLLLERPGEELAFDGATLALGAQRWPAGGDGSITLSMPPNADAVASLPFNTLMAAALGVSEGAGLREMVDGRTVFIGSSAFLGDLAMTPFGLHNGFRVLATAYAVLRQGDVVDPRTPWLDALLVLLALGPGLWLWRRRRPALAWDLGATLGAAALVTGLAVAALALAARQAALLLPLAILAAGALQATVLQLHAAARANRRLRLERAVADAANRAKSDFLAHVSHEIRTPMNALLGVAQLLQRTPLDPDQQRYVEVFRRSGQHLSALIDDLLDLSRIEAGRLALEPAPFALRELLDEQAALLAGKASGRGLMLDWRIADELPPVVLGDRRRLAQVLTNLVGNAIKFTPTGRVEVAVAPQAGAADGPHAVRFAVSDTGIGIDPSEHARVFESFAQVDGGAPAAGTGLGLAIARSLVEQMGGRLALHSALGQGARFEFCIALPPAALPPRWGLAPLLDGATVAPGDPDAPQGPPSTPAAPGAAAGASAETFRAGPAPVLASPPLPRAERRDGRLRVLLTEDNEVNVMIVAAMLAEDDIDLDVARDGEAAIEKFRDGRPGLVLMDMRLPGIDGLEATRAIRRIERQDGRRPVPVIALTAQAYAIDAQRSLAAGCNAHLSKPVRREDLLATIHAFCVEDPGP